MHRAHLCTQILIQASPQTQWTTPPHSEAAGLVAAKPSTNEHTTAPRRDRRASARGPQRRVHPQATCRGTKGRGGSTGAGPPVDGPPSSAPAQRSSGGDNQSVPAEAVMENGASSAAPPRRGTAGRGRHRPQPCNINAATTKVIAKKTQTTTLMSRCAERSKMHEQSLSPNG